MSVAAAACMPAGEVEVEFGLELSAHGRILRLSPAADAVLSDSAGAWLDRPVGELLDLGQTRIEAALDAADRIDVQAVLVPRRQPVSVRLQRVGPVWDGRVATVKSMPEACASIDVLDEGVVLLTPGLEVVRFNVRAVELLDDAATGLQVGADVRSWLDGRVDSLEAGLAERVRILRSCLSVRSGQPVVIEATAGRVLQVWAVEVAGGVQLTLKDITEVQRSEARRLERERSYRMLFENAAEGIYSASLRGTLRDVNPALAQLLGYETSEEMLAQHDSAEILEGSQRDALLRQLDQAGIVRGLERSVRRRDGSEVEVLESLSAMRDAGGRLVGYHGFLQDISVLKAGERALRASETRLKNAVELAGLGMSVNDVDGTLLEVSERYGQILGVSPEDLPIGEPMGERIHRYIHPEDVPAVWGMWQEARNAGRASQVEVRALRTTGEIRVCRLSLKPVLSEAGEISRVIGLLQDVSDVRRLEERLAQRDRELALITANIPGAVVRCVRTETGRYEVPVVAGRLAALWRGESDHHLGVIDLDGLLAPEAGGRFTDLLDESARSRRDVDAVLRYRQADGGPGWLRMVARPQEPVPGRVSWTGVLVDITKQKQFEEKLAENEEMLRQAQKMESIGRFAGGLAHDFNNLLQPMLLMTEGVAQRLPAGSDEADALGDVAETIRDARDLVRQILTFARRGERGAVEVCSLRELVEGRFTLLRTMAPRDVDVRLDLQDGALVRGEPSQLQQVLVNLTANAFDAMGDRGELTIAVRVEQVRGGLQTMDRSLNAGRYGVLSVCDTGPGIRPDMLGRLFDPFYTTKGPSGTGLGLSVVHGIVSAMHGGIRVHSEPHKGTVFEIYLPLASDLRGEEAAPRPDLSAS